MKISKQKLQQIIQEELQEMVDEGEMDEGFLDRTKARVQGAFAGASGAVQQGVAGAKGAFKQGAMGLAQKGLGALGAADAAAEVGAAKEKAAADTAQQKTDIKDTTGLKQQAIKYIQAVEPKIKDIENDFAKLLNDPNFANNERIQRVKQPLAQLKQYVEDWKGWAAAGVKGGKVHMPTTAPNQPVPPGGVPGFKSAPSGQANMPSTRRVRGA